VDLSTGCPANYDELFSTYFPMMRQIVFRAGIAHEDVEDVAMDILARFIQKDGIDYYDPDRLHDVGENPDLPGARYRKAKFKGMLRGFTQTYVMQYRDKQMVRHRREPWRLEKPVTPDGTTTWAESEAYSVDTLADTEVSVVIIHALQRSREILVQRSTSKRDYGRFIDLAVEHGFFEGRLDRRSIQAELGISASTMTQMLNTLRSILRPLLTEAGVVREASTPEPEPTPEPDDTLAVAV
jgi:hypothetical protein